MTGLTTSLELAAPPPQQPINLSDPAERARLTAAAFEGFKRLVGQWRLSGEQAAACLDMSERQWLRMRTDGRQAAMSLDMLTRISLLVGIFKALRITFSTPLCDEWIHLPNSDPLFNGRSPISEITARGIPALIEIRRYMDALRGGL
jgi:hypothetical protein